MEDKKGLIGEEQDTPRTLCESGWENILLHLVDNIRANPMYLSRIK